MENKYVICFFLVRNSGFSRIFPWKYRLGIFILPSYKAKGVSLKRVFIANRGGICRRIAQSPCTLGIEAVCVVEAGKRPQYLQPVIAAFYEVPLENPALYLDVDRMIAIAREM